MSSRRESIRFRFPVRVALVLCLAASLGPTCGPRFDSIAFLEPADGRLQATAQSVFVWGRVGKSVDPASVAFWLDDVDLTAALGLVPPFADEGGLVMVGPDVVTVSGFTFAPPGGATAEFSLTLAGLSAGGHVVTAAGTKNGNLIVRQRSVSLVDGFVQELATTAAAGLPGGPLAVGGRVLANASLGQAIAAPPIVVPIDETLRSGHVEAAEQTLANGGP